MKALLCILSLLITTSTVPAIAQSDADLSVDSVAANSLWKIHMSPQRLFSSRLGELLDEMITAKHPDAPKKIDGFNNALGFDPRTDVEEILLFGDKFDEASATVIARLGGTSGNLEGWFLAAPGYQSENLDKATILHSFVMENKKNNARLWCAVPFNQAEKSYTLVATFDRARTVSLTSRILEQGTKWLKASKSEDAFLSMTVHDLSQVPMKIDRNDPGAAIAKIIRSVKMQATAEADSLVAQGTLVTENPARAQQLQQLLTGLKAMVQLATLHEESPNEATNSAHDWGSGKHHQDGAKMAAELLNNLQLHHEAGSSTLSANLSISYDTLMALKNEMLQEHTPQVP